MNRPPEASATLTVIPNPDGPRGRMLVVTCRHGTSYLGYSNGDGPDAPQLTDAGMAPYAVANHFEAEGCRCTRELRRRYRLLGAGA